MSGLEGPGWPTPENCAHPEMCLLSETCVPCPICPNRPSSNNSPKSTASCPGPTHYAGCPCHEKGWQNKWESAVEMAAQAEFKLQKAIALHAYANAQRKAAENACLNAQETVDRLHAALRNLRDVQGRHHTQIASERLLALLPENS